MYATVMHPNIKVASSASQTMVESLYRRMLKYTLLVVVALLIIYITSSHWHSKTCKASPIVTTDDVIYDEKYPLTDALILPGMKKYKLAVIADLDKDRSKSPNELYKRLSYLKTGYLTLYDSGAYDVEFADKYILSSYLTEKGRGLELSELCVYNKKLYTVDDRTGVVYQLVNNEPIPWVILQDGDGINKKGFKSEWMTVKDGNLYIGSTGKEYTTRTGEFLNFNPMFVKRISPSGHVTHLNWTEQYRNIRTKLGISDPGYVIHEAVVWSDIKKKWFFLPRRLSALKYDDELDENRATHVLISASPDFKDMKFIFVGDLEVTHGFSSFKFIPGTNDDIAIALKTKEVGNDISSYITIFNINTGKTIMYEKGIAKDKYEGIEFL